MAGKKCKDHLGNEFSSTVAMCRHWGISRVTYRGRINSGWAQKDALETPAYVKEKPCTDHLGNQFVSNKAMCEYWGISLTSFKSRIAMG
jgi:hypothetical protein